MPKRLFKRFNSKQQNLKEHKHLRWFKHWLHAPYLWSINRHSVARSFAIGLFITIIPVPIHMLLATASSIIFRANLPISLALVWINNPITMPPVFYFCYVLGAMILHQPIQPVTFPENIEGFVNGIGNNMAPLLLGCLICALILSIVGYLSIHWLWRWHIVHQWKQRRANRLTTNL